MKVFSSIFATAAADSLSGAYEGSVPFIIDVNADFKGDGTADFDLNVKVASKRFNCPGEKITETDSGVTFTDIETTGDCLGDGIRTDGKDPTKYTIAKNSDSTLTFNSDGYPALKMSKKAALAVAETLSGAYEGSVPFIIDVNADFKGDGTADFDLNVKIASKRFNCPGEKITETDSGVTFTDIETTGDCLGDGIRTDGKDPTKYTIAKNSDGTLTFNSDGYPALKMTSKSLSSGSTCSLYEIADGSCGQSDLDCDYTKYAKAAESALQDGTCADQGYTVKTGTQTKSYPVIGDIVISTYSKAVAAASTCSLYAIDADVCGQSDLDCSYTKYAKAAEKSLQDGNCADQGYTVKGDSTTKSYPVIGDIVITQYTKTALAVADSLSGAYEGSVPFIIDVNADFKGDGTADFDLNVKIASKRFNCPGEKITETDSGVTFTDIETSGDCLGDGIRTDGKDPTKYTIAKNSDGTLTFNSDGYPALKMTSKSGDILV